MSELYEWTLIIIPRFTSLLSILGSSMIILQVARSETNRGHTQQRLVCAMSIIDVMVSTSWFLTPLFVTKDMEQFKWAFGNEFSCSLQGFIVQASIGGVLYNACLSIYYFLVIKYGYPQHKMVIIERLMHAFTLIFSLSTATIALALGLIQDANWDCWISPQNKIYQWSFFFAPLWLAIILVTILMYKIFLHVRQEERSSSRWNQIGNRVVRLRKTRAVAKQGALYVGAFFVTWLFPTISRVIHLISGKDPPSWLVVLSGAFIPIQGFFNALVYFRLRFINCQRENPEKTRRWVVSTIIRRALCCCNTCREDADGLDIEPPSSSQHRASAISAEPREPCSRRLSLTSIHRGVQKLQNLYERTNLLFFGREKDGEMLPPSTITLGDGDAEIEDRGNNLHDSLSTANNYETGDDMEINNSREELLRWEDALEIHSDEEVQILATASKLEEK